MYAIRSHVRTKITKVRLNRSEASLLVRLAKEHQKQPAVMARELILARLAELMEKGGSL